MMFFFAFSVDMSLCLNDFHADRFRENLKLKTKQLMHNLQIIYKRLGKYPLSQFTKDYYKYKFLNFLRFGNKYFICCSKQNDVLP